MLLENQVALITGAANGIGRATALRFVQEGAKVVISDVDESGLAETKGQIDAAGGQCVVVVGSVASDADAQKMVDAAVSNFGTLHILINNAGITRDGLTARVKDGEVKFLPEDSWDVVLDVNLKGTWLCCQKAAVPMMAQQYGRIVKPLRLLHSAISDRRIMPRLKRG
jgi:3-oxoacyl-[acyl-carrier protein] reductase